MKYFIIFAGPNGSGKSSLKSSLEKDSLLFRHLEFSLKEVQYINADFCARNISSISQMPSGVEKDLAAWKATEEWRNRALLAGENLIWETVFSHESRLEEIDRAHSLGYYVLVIYVTTLSSTINIERVKIRAQHGGHTVPSEKVISRYERSIKLLPEIVSHADEVLVYDNSSSRPYLIFSKLEKMHVRHLYNDSGNIELAYPSKKDIGEERYAWITEHLIQPLEKQGYAVTEVALKK